MLFIYDYLDEKCGKYNIQYLTSSYYYKDLSTAIKALYAYKKAGVYMKGYKYSCD